MLLLNSSPAEENRILLKISYFAIKKWARATRNSRRSFNYQTNEHSMVHFRIRVAGWALVPLRQENKPLTLVEVFYGRPTESSSKPIIFAMKRLYKQLHIKTLASFTGSQLLLNRSKV